MIVAVDLACVHGGVGASKKAGDVARGVPATNFRGIATSAMDRQAPSFQIRKKRHRRIQGPEQRSFPILDGPKITSLMLLCSTVPKSALIILSLLTLPPP